MSRDELDLDLEDLLKRGLHESVEQSRERLEGLEERVLEGLSERLLRRSPWAKLHEFFAGPVAGLSRPALALSFAAVAAIFLGLGIFLGIQFGGPLIGLELGGGGNGVWFVVAYPEAESVTVAGDFSNWEEIPLKRGRDGIWVLRLELPPGRYEYAFKVDGKKWIPDPRADEYVKTYGDQYNSVIYV